MDPDPAALGDEEVQVWRIAVTGPVGGGVATDVLDASERARAAALRRPADRAGYVLAHVALRHVLGRAIGVAPHVVTYERAPCVQCGEPHGKPRLATDTPVRFNLSRRADLAVVAVARRGDVGVDVEPRSAAGGLRATAAQFAGPGEVGSDELDLLRLWTRKEAVLKAVGAGLTIDPSTVTVGPPSGGDAWRPAGGGWRVADLELDPDHVGAVACSWRSPRVVMATWTGPFR